MIGIRMNRFILVIAVTLALLSPASAGFQDGLEAYYRLNYETALREWRPLAERGDRRAQYQLGILYYRGEGVFQDYGQAAKWFRRAAERGDPDAQFNLALLYLDGKGLPQDLVRAHLWFDLADRGYASMQGQDWAVENRQWAARNRNWAAKQMTNAEVAKARRLARRWRPKQ